MPNYYWAEDKVYEYDATPFISPDKPTTWKNLVRYESALKEGRDFGYSPINVWAMSREEFVEVFQPTHRGEFLPEMRRWNHKQP